MPIQIDLGSTSSSKPVQKKSGPLVGIDLGTTNSLVAFAQDGKNQVLHEKNESPLLPSVVKVSDDGKIEAVGIEAYKQRGQYPKNTIFSVKRLLGRSLKDLQTELTQIPFNLVDDEHHAQARIKVGSRVISPIEISAEILKVLKTRAELALGESVDRAVITVPAYFDDAQRGATKAAGRLAGLEVVRVVNEPTAAALAYGWSFDNPGLVAVYDLGGGTFDISILRIEDKLFEVLATHGDTKLGGDDFDRLLANLAISKSGLNPTEVNFSELLLESERAKRVLGEKDEVLIVKNHNGKSTSVKITKTESERIWLPLVTRTLEACQRALSDARLQKSDLKDILLVGGATRMPLVRMSLTEFFDHPVNTSLNPDEAIALGAARQAEILSGRGGDRLLLDVVPLSLGVETVGGAVSRLIHRNSTLPIEAREVYTNHAEKQTAFDIHIVQGERELVKDCRSLASFKLRGLTPAPPGYHRMEILFRIDTNGILNVRAKNLRTNESHEIEVTPSYGISDEELLQMLENAYNHAESDMDSRQLVDARVEAETIIRAGEKTLANVGHFLDAEELAIVKARLGDLKNSAKGSSYKAIRTAIEEFDLVSRDLAEMQVNQALSKSLTGRYHKKV